MPMKAIDGTTAIIVGDRDRVTLPASEAEVRLTGCCGALFLVLGP